MLTSLERANLLALLYVVFSCVFFTFPIGVPGRVWYLIVAIPDLSLPIYLYSCNNVSNPMRLSAPRNWFKPSSKIFYGSFQGCTSFVDHLCFCVSHAFVSVHCCLVVNCWERTDLLALVGDVIVILLLSHVVAWVSCGT